MRCIEIEIIRAYYTDLALVEELKLLIATPHSGIL
jgi:hypothetical protein